MHRAKKPENLNISHLLFGFCQKAEPLDPLAEKGKSVYNSTCISCHNVNPAVDGALGPAVKGSSYELLYARVIIGNYPEGYTPKRTSQLMQKLPLADDDIKALEAYLKN